MTLAKKKTAKKPSCNHVTCVSRSPRQWKSSPKWMAVGSCQSVVALTHQKIDYLTCGAFDCIFSDSPWQLFARLIGKWREFRPSSSWVFGSWEVGNSGSRDSKVFEIPKYKNIQRGHDLKHHRLRSRGLRYVWIIWQNSFVGPKIERNWKNRRQQKKSRRMLSMNGIEEQFRCIKPYSKDIRRMNLVLIFPWCRTSGIHGNADFSTLNKKSRIFICNDTTVLQICRLFAHTFTDKNHGRMLFPCALHAAKPRHLRHFWFRVSQFASSHRFWNKNYGLSMWRPRPRYEWRFVKHQRTDDLPQSVLTVDSHCQSTCKVCVQSSVNQSFISCGAELLTARHLICASKRFFGCQNLHCHFVKPHVFCCLPTWLLFIFAAKSVLLSRVSLAKGYPERAFFLQYIIAQRTKL